MGKTVELLGTTHNTQESLEQVQNIIRERKPDVVAVELPPKTFADGPEWSLRASLDPREPITVPGYLLYRYDIDGELWQVDEMFAAAETAAEVGATVALIDRPFADSLDANARAVPRDLFAVLQSLRQEARVHREGIDDGWKEVFERDIWRLGEVVSPLINYGKALHRYGATNLFDADQREAAANRMRGKERGLLKIVRAVFPRWVESHIDERDACMAGHLKWLAAEEDDIVAVLGAGHVPGVKARLEGARRLTDDRIREPITVESVPHRTK